MSASYVCASKLNKARTRALSLTHLHQAIVSTGHDMGKSQVNMPDANPPPQEGYSWGRASLEQFG